MTTIADLELLDEYLTREARVSYFAFRKYMQPKMKIGWFVKNICGHLQQFYEDYAAGLSPKLVLQAPPQHGKSEAVVYFLAWLAGNDPAARQIYASFSERLGIRANLKLQRIFDSEKYQRIFPKTNINKSNSVTISGQYLRNREIMEFIGHEGFFRNTTVRGSITGESLDIGVIDDPIKGRADARSRTVRDSAWHWLTDDFNTRFSEHGAFLAILTRWHLDDPIGRLIAKDPTVKVVTYKAIADEDEDHRKKGDALFPEHKSLKFLTNLKNTMAATSWASLYQQTPTLEEGELFKPDKINIIPVAPVDTRWVRAWDFASTKDGGDYTASVRIGITGAGRYVIGHVTRGRWLADDRDTHLKAMTEQDGKHSSQSIPQDPGQAGKSQVAGLVKMLAGYSVHSSTESGDKYTRAEAFASQVNAGNVDMVQGDWNKDYTDELRHFPQGTFDDQIDASSRGFNFVCDKLQKGMFDFDLPVYDEVPITLYKLILRIQASSGSNTPHSYSLIGYTMHNDFEQLDKIMRDVDIPFTHAMKNSIDYSYLLDAGRWFCGFTELCDNIVELLQHIGRNMMPRETFGGVVIEDDNMGSALRQTLLEHKRLNDWGAVRIGLTPQYKDKFARANESAIQLRQGKLIIPASTNRYTNSSSDIQQFLKEFNTFTETGNHISDQILNTTIWEVVSQHGAAPRTVWNP